MIYTRVTANCPLQAKKRGLLNRMRAFLLLCSYNFYTNLSPGFTMKATTTPSHVHSSRDYLQQLGHTTAPPPPFETSSSSSLSQLLETRDSLMQRLAHCLLELQLVNGQIDEKIHEGEKEILRERQRRAGELEEEEEEVKVGRILGSLLAPFLAF